jgi:DNA repair protein RadC
MNHIRNPQKAAHFFRKRMSIEVEEVWVAALNAAGKVTAAQCLFRGTVDQCLAHPRDIFRFACIHNACSILVAHNHPSGPAQPSPEDWDWTRRLNAGAELLMIPLADHVIIGRKSYFSFMENGAINRDQSSSESKRME